MPGITGPWTHLGRTVATSVVVVSLVTIAGAASGASPSPSEMAILPGEPWIVYDWNSEPGHTNGLFAVRPDGADDHVILPAFSDASGSAEWGREGALHPDWSPDGSMLAFTNGADDSWTIWVANVDGSDARMVVPCSAPCQYVDDVAWSPDGRKLAYRRHFGEWPPPSYTFRTALEILDLTTGETMTLLESTAQAPENPEFYWTPRWSPDGRQLVLSIGHIEGVEFAETAIAVVDASGETPATPRIITDWDLFALYPDWHPTQDLIVFDTYTIGYFGIRETTDLYTIRSDGNELTQLTNNAGKEEWASQPTWTPDGTQIVFTHVGRTPTGGLNPDSFQVAFMDPDGTDLRILDGGYRAHPRLRPTP